MANAFYTHITKVKEDFVNKEGSPASVDLPLVTLPAGTVLFRGMKIPNPSLGEDFRSFYRDFLGNPEGSQHVCLSPIHNVFFYPFPYIAFGANDVGKTFTMMQAVVLVHPMTVVCAVSPSEWVRGIGNRYNGTAPWQRCSNLSGKGIDCHPRSYQETEAASYDNCLHPEYQMRSGTRGWMALADLDSINPKKKVWGSNKPIAMKDSPMGSFLRTLEGQIPGEGTKAIGWAYTDDNRHAGFPEIALYPYKTHKGSKLITRPCATEDMAIRLLSKEASSDNLNYLPLAAFTKSGVIDMVGSDFSYERVSPNITNAGSAQQAILQAVYSYMNTLQTKGITLPHYGPSKLTFDSRTGFFALDSVVPPSLKIPIPPAVLDAEKAAGNPSKFSTVLYKFLLLPLDTPEAQKRAMTYMLLFRSYMPEHFLEKYPIEKGYAMRRAMIFNRFPVLSPLFTELELKAPKEFLEPLDRAGKLYRKEMGIPTRIPKAIAPAPPAPAQGGKRKTRSSKKRGTRKQSPEQRAAQYASLFRQVWKNHRA